MKKMMLLGVLLAGAAVQGHAQESRQDVSVSFMGVLAPDVYGGPVHPMVTSKTGGFLGSYRYLLTPRSGLELNYSWAQNSILYNTTSKGNLRVHNREQEITGAYVYSRTYKNWNPFVEIGVGGVIFTPILDSGTQTTDTRQNTNIGALFGGGVAYELSPSFDLRIQYRGMLLKAPDFGVPGDPFKTNKYFVRSTPAVGIAYHF